ncbi:hypothetical protein WR25_12917 [Diploscapter pachys]|uniref:Uncharacterized protein n=1 Tax=Diploscapter pachys TaxID=2018661 RepID=A0A2A2M5X4_9BILA|nr:hypothetical protein WR25_12917 [Diploscapter pachys]
MIWPANDGSVMISWYPVIAVWKHTSPTAAPSAPKPRPQATSPFARTRTPVAPSGFAGMAMGLGSAMAWRALLKLGLGQPVHGAAAFR